MHPSLLSPIAALTGFSETELISLFKQFESRTLKKKTLLLAAGETAQELYLIQEGCMRLYYEKDGTDISAYFFTEGMFAGAYDSFTAREASRHSIEAIEECKVLMISYEGLQELFEHVPRANEFVRKVLEERFRSLHQLFTSQLLDSPEERYLNLLRYQPGLLQRVPQHQIATFLGVTPVSLSRIRNRVAKR